jgi:hypothetical protein
MGRENAPPPAQGRKKNSLQVQQLEQQQQRQQQCNGSSNSNSSSSSSSSDAGSFAAHTLPLCFAMMAELREDVHWSSSQESEGSAGEVCIHLNTFIPL